MASASKRLDRAAWIDGGLAALGDAGPSALKISSLAERLGVTKGSFYWHFRDIEDLKNELLAAWELQFTSDVVRAVDESGGTAKQRLRRLLDVAFATDTKVARAVRQWSAIDAHAERAQFRVDRMRVDYIAGLLRDLGWNPKKATTLARWCYWAIIGMHVTRTSTPTPAETDVVLSRLLP